MSLIAEPHALTIPQLEARIRWHQSMADMFKSRDQSGMTKKFTDLVEIYRKELESRLKP